MSESSLDSLANKPGSTQPVKKQLGERLLDAGIINRIQLELALREQKRRKIFLGEALVELGFVTHDELASQLANEARTESVNVLDMEIHDDVLQLVPYELAKRLHVLPVEEKDGTLTLCMADTFDVMAVDMLEKKTGKRIHIVGAPTKDILDALEKIYAQSGSIAETVDQLLQQEIAVQDGDESLLIRLVNQIIAQGIHKSATDIHIIPAEKVIEIRLRVDGILRKIALIPMELQLAIATRVKIMASLDVTEKRIPQDGRIRYNIGRRRVDLRTSTLPTVFGESIVLRILDQSPKSLTLEQLGMSQGNRNIFAGMIAQPHGIILVTGPTGSGKTTTLYTALGQIDAVEKGIFTLEDPIEYSIPMIRQIQINEDVGLSFAAGLRSLLRQDPDVILVGEIRDEETASLSVRAALTGHLVFSTLHTNDAAGAIPRLMDMGIEPYLLPSCLTGIIAQRLVRRICSKCKREVDDVDAHLAELGVSSNKSNGIKLWQGVGCEDCNHTGYSGRVAIHEILQLDTDFHHLIIENAGSSAIQALAAKKGMRTLKDDGISRALKGDTTLEEVLRIAGGSHG